MVFFLPIFGDYISPIPPYEGNQETANGPLIASSSFPGGPYWSWLFHKPRCVLGHWGHVQVTTAFVILEPQKSSKSQGTPQILIKTICFDTSTWKSSVAKIIMCFLMCFFHMIKNSFCGMHSNMAMIEIENLLEIWCLFLNHFLKLF